MNPIIPHKTSKNRSKDLVRGLLSGRIVLRDYLDYFCEEYDIPGLLRKSGLMEKTKISAVEFIKYEYRLIFYGITASANKKGKTLDSKVSHSTLNRFQNDSNIDWFRFTLLLAGEVFEKIKRSDPSLEGIGGVMCVDDTDFIRNSSKKAEFISKKASHNTMKYYKGYKLLAICFFFAGEYVPLGGYLVSSSDSAKILFRPEGGPKGPGEKRRFEMAQSTLIDAMVEILTTASFYGFKVDYVVFDSWFAESETIRRVFDLGYHVIGMLKGKKKTRYLHNGKWLTVSEVYHVLDLLNPLAAEETEEGGILFSADVVAKTGSGVFFPLRLVFLKNYTKRRVYACLACTDLTLPPEAIAKIYSVRWVIEVVFWLLKSDNIRMNSNRRPLSLNAMSEHIAICVSLLLMVIAEKGGSGSEASLWSQLQTCKREILDVQWLNATLGGIKSTLDIFKGHENEPWAFEMLVKKLLGDEDFMDRIDRLPSWAFKTVDSSTAES